MPKRRNANEQLKSSYLIKISRLEGEAEAALQDVSKLEGERAELNRAMTIIQDELDKLRADEARNKALVAATEENNNRLQKEVELLRDDIRTYQQERDDFFQQTVKATSELHAAVGELEQTKERKRSAGRAARPSNRCTSRRRDRRLDRRRFRGFEASSAQLYATQQAC